MQDQILDMLLKRDEITWQDLIKGLIKSEEMDPWDVDISLLAQRYVDIVKQLKEVNFFVSGKVVLAASILLKIKTNNLLNSHFANFDSLLFSNDDDEEDQGYSGNYYKGTNDLNVKLTIKTPQTRKRKVTLNDLVGALEKALEVDERREIRKRRFERIPEEIKIPERKINLGEKIKSIHGTIIEWFQKSNSDITFEHLLDGGDKTDKVYTFMPLLHLENHDKICMNQPKHFENIYIRLKPENENNERDKEG
jgi:segregation and condensation protein A